MVISGQHQEPQQALVRHGRLRQPGKSETLLPAENEEVEKSGWWLVTGGWWLVI
jgi:hypothetical protein